MKTWKQSVPAGMVTALLLAGLTASLTGPSASAQGMFYKEEAKDGRIYVFNQMSEYAAWMKTGEMGKSISRVGEGPNGETLVFDTEDAINFYNFRHDKPSEVFQRKEEAKPAESEFKVKVGGTIYADYTFTDSPKGKDADGHSIQSNSWNVGRAYLNVTGNVTKLIAFRITPDISRENGDGSTLKGSYSLRLKYAFGQLNLDEWLGHGSWIRLGQQQTPIVDFNEAIYRYRFQGTVMEEREGYLTSSDVGLSMHVAIPGDYGDVHAGYYNGDGYSKAEANDQKAWQIRATLRPAPGTAANGFRITGFYDKDAYIRDGKRERLIGEISWDSSWLNAGALYLKTRDRTSPTKPEADGKGFSIFATPRTSFGLEALLRYDEFRPNDSSDAKKKRTIAGLAYWFPVTEKGAACALLLDYDNVKYEGVSPSRPNDTRYALHMLVNF